MKRSRGRKRDIPSMRSKVLDLVKQRGKESIKKICGPKGENPRTITRLLEITREHQHFKKMIGAKKEVGENDALYYIKARLGKGKVLTEKTNNQHPGERKPR